MLSPNQKQIFHTLSFNQKLQIVFKFDSHYDTWLILSYSTKINQWVKVNLAMWKCESRIVKSSTSRISSHCQNGIEVAPLFTSYCQNFNPLLDVDQKINPSGSKWWHIWTSQFYVGRCPSVEHFWWLHQLFKNLYFGLNPGKSKWSRRVTSELISSVYGFYILEFVLKKYFHLNFFKVSKSGKTYW